jgi:hypothetical protein
MINKPHVLKSIYKFEQNNQQIDGGRILVEVEKIWFGVICNNVNNIFLAMMV